jgi:hypothetical protein
MGAIKCLYALANEPQLAPACAVAISPPRLSYSWFCSNPEASEFLQTYQLAERYVAEGRASTLMDVKLPLPFIITAGGYQEKYGPLERYNYLRFVASVPCPTLLTLGSIEVANNLAFRELPKILGEITSRNKHLCLEMIADADHFYNGQRAALASRLIDWLRQTLGQQLQTDRSSRPAKGLTP